MKKKINNNLSKEQEKIMFEEGTALPNSSELNYEKDFALQYLQNLGDSDSEMKQYNALPSLPAFIDPYTTPTVDQNDIIIDDATRKRLEQYGL